MSPSPFSVDPPRVPSRAVGQEEMDAWERVSNSVRSVAIVRRIEFTAEKKQKELKAKEGQTEKKDKRAERTKSLLLR